VSTQLQLTNISIVSVNNVFFHKSLSPVSSSVIPHLVILPLQPSIHLSLDLPVLRVPFGSHSRVLQLQSISWHSLYVSKHKHFSSVTSNTIYSVFYCYTVHFVIIAVLFQLMHIYIYIYIYTLKTPIILLLMRITSFHVYVLERYDICMIRAIPSLRVTSNHAYVISL